MVQQGGPSDPGAQGVFGHGREAVTGTDRQLVGRHPVLDSWFGIADTGLVNPVHTKKVNSLLTY